MQVVTKREREREREREELQTSPGKEGNKWIRKSAG